MTGSLQIKKNIYYAVINVKTEDGVTKRKWVSTGIRVTDNNNREAARILRKLIQQYEETQVAYSKEILFSDWIKIWLDNVKSQIELTTYEGYESYAFKHIIPYFSIRKIRLSKIQPHHIQEYYIEKLSNGRLDGKGGLKASSIKKHNVVIQGSLQSALKLNIIAYNPAFCATLPRIEKHFVLNFYTEDQAKQLISVCKGTSIETAIILALYYGLRRSEVLGLKWNAIDFNNGTLIIRNTVVRVKTLVEKERAKNKSSYRTLPLIDEVRDYLIGLSIRQAEDKELWGDSYSNTDYICKWSDGRPLSPSYVTRKFGKILPQNADFIRVSGLFAL